jgi:hypothetical protein
LRAQEYALQKAVAGAYISNARHEGSLLPDQWDREGGNVTFGRDIYIG